MEAPTKGAPWRRWPAARAKRDGADARPRKGRRGRWGVERAHTRRADACRAPVPYVQRRARRGTAREDAEAAMGSRGGRSVRVVPRGGRDGRGSGVRRGTGRRGDVRSSCAASPSCRRRRRARRVDGDVHASVDFAMRDASGRRSGRCARAAKHYVVVLVPPSSGALDVGWRLALAFGVARAPTKILDDTVINSNVRMV